MAYLKIHCGYCGGRWDVYHRVRKFDTAGRCPHCDSRIDGETWAKILKAYDAMNAVNMELQTNHEFKHLPWFEADYINDGIFQDNDKNDIMNIMSEGLNGLRDEVGELRAALEKKGKATT